MREIKFRAWDKRTKKMVYKESDYSDDMEFDEFYRAVCTLYCDISEIAECYEFIPMQYTGLKDKNGKEIYEGDIVEWLQDEGRPISLQRVEWFENGWSPFGYWQGHYQNNNKTILWEVVGNLYEQPNLLTNK